MSDTTHPAMAETKAPRTAPARLPFYLNTRTFFSHIFFGPYIYIPLICAFTWLAALLCMMGLWVHTGKPRYEETQSSVAFISDVAGKHKAVFIPLCAVTGALYPLSLLAERWLRYAHRLPEDIRRRENILSWLSIVCAVIGGAALILLAIFDTFNHGKIHWSMTCLFVVGVAFSAVFQSGQLWSLHKVHPDRPSLLRNSIIKIIIVVLAVAGAITFAALYGTCRGSRTARGKHTEAQCNRITSACAAMEWSIAFGLFFYFLTLVADLWGAGKTSPRYIRRIRSWQDRNGISHEVETVESRNGSLPGV